MTNPPPILLGEDDASHVLLVRRYLQKGGLVNPVRAMDDGAEVIAYLRGEGQYADRAQHPIPAVVIIDLRLRSGSGLEILRAIRENKSLAHTPVVVMSGSTEDTDIDEVHRLGAAAYLVKPIAFSALLDVIHQLGLPWALQLPPGGDRP
jgi:CheY-like chemotaxis protein